MMNRRIFILFVLVFLFTSTSLPMQAGFEGKTFEDIAWSPDGQTVIGVGNTAEPLIYTFDGELQNRNDNLDEILAGGMFFPNHRDIAVAWSPDGTQFMTVTETLPSSDDPDVTQESYSELRLYTYDREAQTVNQVANRRFNHDTLRLTRDLVWTRTNIFFSAYDPEEAQTTAYEVNPDDLDDVQPVPQLRTTNDETGFHFATNGEYLLSVTSWTDHHGPGQMMDMFDFDAYYTPSGASLDGLDDFRVTAWGANANIALAGLDTAIQLHGGQDLSTVMSLVGYLPLPESAIGRIIIDLGWSADGRFLAALDDAGTVYVWDVPASEVLDLATPMTVNALDWHPEAQILALGLTDVTVQIINFDDLESSG